MTRDTTRRRIILSSEVTILPRPAPGSFAERQAINRRQYGESKKRTVSAGSSLLRAIHASPACFHLRFPLRLMRSLRFGHLRSADRRVERKYLITVPAGRNRGIRLSGAGRTCKRVVRRRCVLCIALAMVLVIPAVGSAAAQSLVIDLKMDNVPIRIDAADSGDHFGWDFANCDFNGDGLVDLVVSAEEAAGIGNTKLASGKVYLILGGAEPGPERKTPSRSRR